MEDTKDGIPETSNTEITRKRKRFRPENKNNRKGRLVVRNLSFKTTEQKLRKHFEEFGEITEVNILKRPDGKLVGCGFIQFAVVQSAAKAIHYRSGKEFLGRPIICDWAIGKSTYEKNLAEYASTQVKEEKIDVKEEVIEIKEENEDCEIKDIKPDNDKEENEVNDEGNEESDEDSKATDEESEESGEDSEEDKNEEPEIKKPKFISNDVNEGKTIFIKNVPFSATNEDVRECMSQFGPLHYALVCMDRLTEHSKGTAFVKFKNLEDAEKCLEAGTELTLMDNILDCHKAISKSDLDKKKVKPEKKDSRNLYLVKEGVILAGSKAAQTVSATDMAKRLQLEKWKTQMLRNLNMFVSRYRLVIHNLPETCDDSKLRQLVTKYAGPKAVIKECRVMRDMRNMDKTGKGKSKEFGFVSFQEHEDALKVMRAMNNNPVIFSEARRPIISFSIENKAVINAKKQRMEKSKLNNPTYKNNPDQKQKIEEAKNNNRSKQKNTEEHSNETTAYGGVKAKVGETKMRSKLKLKKQASIHHENLKKRRKQLKHKKILQLNKEVIRQPQQKQNTKKKKQTERDNFSSLVNKYKSKLLVDNKKVKNKWYNE